MSKSKIETLLIVDVKAAFNWLEFFGVFHLFGQNGEDETVFVFVDLLDSHFLYG